MPLYVQLATDNFTRANETPLSNGGNWLSPANGGAQINLVSNNAQSTSTANDSRANWQGITWPNDQYSEVTIGAGYVSTSAVEASVRCSTSAGVNTLYRVIAQPTVWTISRNLAGVGVTLLSGATTFSVGDVARLEVIGTTLTAFRNGIVLGSISDANIASGRAGIGEFDTVTPSNAKISLWNGGQILPSAQFRSLMGVGI